MAHTHTDAFLCVNISISTKPFNIVPSFHCAGCDLSCTWAAGVAQLPLRSRPQVALHQTLGGEHHNEGDGMVKNRQATQGTVMNSMHLETCQELSDMMSPARPMHGGSRRFVSQFLSNKREHMWYISIDILTYENHGKKITFSPGDLRI